LEAVGIEARIKNSKDFEDIFKNGKTIISKDRKIKATYYLFSNGSFPEIKFATTVSSKAGGAVWRNRIKRIIRESIRTEKKPFKELVLNNDLSLFIILSPNKLNQCNSKNVLMADIKPAILEIISTLKKITCDMLNKGKTKRQFEKKPNKS